MNEGVVEGEIARHGGSTINLVSNAAIVITIGLFSSGILTIRKIHNSKSVGSVPHLPFLAAATNCSLWLLYGVKKPDSTISLVNTVGLSLQLFYIFVYHIYVDNKACLFGMGKPFSAPTWISATATFRPLRYFVRRDFVVSLCIVVTIVIIYNVFILDLTATINHLGIICNFFTICFFASPLSTMAEVIRSQSTESMSFPLSVMSFLTSGSWTVYGFLINDTYVEFPNFVGMLLSVVQLSLFLLYTDKRPKRSSTADNSA